MLLPAKSFIIIIIHYDNLGFKEKIQNEPGIAFEPKNGTLRFLHL